MDGQRNDLKARHAIFKKLDGVLQIVIFTGYIDRLNAGPVIFHAELIEVDHAVDFPDQISYK